MKVAIVNQAFAKRFFGELNPVQIQESLLRERLMASLCIAFGILAGCLSALGLYGVMPYMAARLEPMYRPGT